MTGYTPTGTSGRERTESDVVADLALRAAPAQQLDKRGIYLAVTEGGGREVVDISERLLLLDATRPARKSGNYTITDVDDFLSYLDKHIRPETELWGDDKTGTIRAAINAHGDTYAGHEDHIAFLALQRTRDWTDWTKRDGQLLPQLEFSEFIEDHLPNFLDPTGADMLELAQTFQANTKVDFASSQRLQSGETALNYVENTTAAAGKKGQIAIPDTFELALQVHERGPLYKVRARLRYRITGGTLALGYRLDRIDDVRRTAFDEVAAKVTESGYAVWHTA